MGRGVQIPPFNSYSASSVVRGQSRIEKSLELWQNAMCAIYFIQVYT
jgi:hypothetical protein